jgi:two-component system, cell cycle sensor histidine kinase and response regulator CckA
MKSIKYIFSLKSLSIRLKLILFFCVTIIILSGILVVVVNYQFADQMMYAEKEELEATANLVASMSLNHLQMYDYQSIQQNVNSIIDRENIMYIAVYNKNNDLVAFSSKIDLGKIQKINKEEISGTYYRHNKYTDEQGETFSILCTTKNIYDEGASNIWGKIELGISLRKLEEKSFRIRHDIYYTTFAFIIFGLVVGSFYYSKFFFKPIREIVKGTIEAGRGNLDYKIHVYSNDELAVLATSFNNMTEELKISRQEIENWGIDLEKRIHERTRKLEKSEAALLNILNDFREANEKLKESEERYRRFFEEDLTADFISTVDGKMISCNPAFAKIFGYSSVEEALEYSARTNYPNTKVREEFLALLKEKKKLEYHEMELVNRHGKKIYIIENVYGHFDEAGNLTHIRGYMFDNTERKGLEEQLLQSQKMQAIGTLAGGIAHDFNNVMGIILGVLDMIEQKGKEKDLLKYIDMGKKAVDRGAGVAKQLLMFSRSEKGDFKPISLHHIVNEVVNIIRHSFPKNIELEVKSALKNGIILGDSSQIHQTILNLCVNARDAMEDGGVISIQLKTVKGEDIVSKFKSAKAINYVALTVADTGIGMPKEIIERIFEPFYTTKERGKGTGLGLSIIYGIINNHNAFVDVQSEVGRGSIFTIYFPTIETVDKAAGLSTHQDIVGGSETILVIDDEESLLNVVVAGLNSAGYKTLTARDGVEAIDIYKKQQKSIDLVLSDLGLPKLSGDQVFNELKEITPNVKVIIATGYIEVETKSHLLNLGVKNILQKPLKLTELLKSVREILDIK